MLSKQQSNEKVVPNIPYILFLSYHSSYDRSTITLLLMLHHLACTSIIILKTCSIISLVIQPSPPNLHHNLACSTTISSKAVPQSHLGHKILQDLHHNLTCTITITATRSIYITTSFALLSLTSNLCHKFTCVVAISFKTCTAIS